MRLYNLLWIQLVVLVSLMLACENNEYVNQAGRFVSDSIKCDDDDRCFEMVDSLFIISNLSKISWQPLPLSDSLISFHDYSDVGENATILVLHNYNVEEAGKYIIRLGSDDGFRLFVNGNEATRRIVGRSVKPDSDWIEVELQKGLNQLVFQVNQGTGGWGLYYEIEKNPNIKKLISDRIFEIYRDLPEELIIADSSKFLKVKQDPRQKLDTFHNIAFSWFDPLTRKILDRREFVVNQSPELFRLPGNPIYPLLFEYEVLNEIEEVIYKERIPVFNRSSVVKIIDDIFHSKKMESPWLKGLEYVFAEELGVRKKQEYSTRMKSEFLWDLLVESGEILYSMGGPRTFLFNGELAKRYTPYEVEDGMPEAIAIHAEFTDTVTAYFESYPGGSHALMASWISYAEFFDVSITVPLVNEKEQKLNTSSVLNEFKNLAASYAVIAWSKSVTTTLNALKDKSYPINKAFFISPWLVENPTEQFVLSRKIEQRNPELEIYIWHGLEDLDVPSYIINGWVEEMNNQNIETVVEEIPYSTHWTFWEEPEPQIYRLLSKKK